MSAQYPFPQRGAPRDPAGFVPFPPVRHIITPETPADVMSAFDGSMVLECNSLVRQDSNSCRRLMDTTRHRPLMDQRQMENFIRLKRFEIE